MISKMGHYDQLTISDAGLPVPGGVKRIDLAVKLGLPGMEEVMEVVLSELKIQRAILAQEMQEQNQALYKSVTSRLAQEGAEITMVPHAEFKELTKNSKAVIRTGECVAFANIILESNVTF